MGTQRNWLVGGLFWFAVTVNVVADTTAERADVGVVERVQQRAEAVYAGQTRRLASASSVFYQDLLRTGRAARLRATLADGSAITMGENAELAIDEFVYDPEGSTEITLNALKGALLFISDKLRGGDDRSVHVRTPVAILGVRGTEFWVGPIDGATGVLVIDGEVVVGSANGMVTLGPGDGTMIKADGTLSPRKIWGEAKVKRALDMVAID
jgi:hypothetical protein